MKKGKSSAKGRFTHFQDPFYEIQPSGLPESHDRQSENYKQVLKEFISYKDLVIEDNIEFQNVNRQRGDRKQLSIIARFMKYSRTPESITCI